MTTIIKFEHVDVTVYLHRPADGAPYVVVDIDSEADLIPLQVYRNDAPVYTEGLTS